MDECKPLPRAAARVVGYGGGGGSRRGGAHTRDQGLTLVHFSAQLERILWHRGAFRDWFGGAWVVFIHGQEVSGGIMKRSIRGCLRCILCQKWLKLS